MTNPKHNVKKVNATISCDSKGFRCVIEMDGGSELYFNGTYGVEMFLNMLDMFIINDGEYDDKETIH